MITKVWDSMLPRLSKMGMLRQLRAFSGDDGAVPLMPILCIQGGVGKKKGHFGE
jgi:hypothetical protein